MRPVTFLLLLSVLFGCQSAPPFDILITNATIYDGSGNAPIETQESMWTQWLPLANWRQQVSRSSMPFIQIVTLD